MQYALAHVPTHHRLYLLYGAYVPHSEELTHSNYTVVNMREGHYWDKDLANVYNRYSAMCRQNNRKCDFVHFHYRSLNKFGDKVCSFAKRQKADGVILSRRSDKQGGILRRFLGSGSQAVVNHCDGVPVTLVSVDDDEKKPSEAG